MLFVVLIITIFSLAAMTYLFPLLAFGLSKLSAGIGAEKYIASGIKPRKLAVLVPVHNGEDEICRTLSSIFKARAAFVEDHPDCSVDIWIGLDGCTDASEQIVKNYDVKILSRTARSGKWQMLLALVNAAKGADWVVFADSGVIWPVDTLAKLYRAMLKSVNIACLPAYKNEARSRLEQILWSFERSIKRLENLSGGPVSAHGATVAYRMAELEKVFYYLSSLSKHDWLNDDVVLPLCLRAFYPTRQISYLADLIVYDKAVKKKKNSALMQMRRRKRMLVGNLEWIIALLPSLAKRNKIAFILSLRRFFRVFWAYWLVFAGVVFIAFFATSSFLISLAVILLLLSGFSSSFRSFYIAAFVSLLSPFYLFSLLASRQSSQASGFFTFHRTEWR